MQAEKMVQITVAEGHTIRRDDVTRDSEGRATKQVKHRYKPGQTLEVEESEAERLKDSGHAVRMSEPMTHGETAGGAVFRAGDSCKRGTVKYPTSTDAAEPKGQ